MDEQQNRPGFAIYPQRDPAGGDDLADLAVAVGVDQPARGWEAGSAGQLGLGAELAAARVETTVVRGELEAALRSLHQRIDDRNVSGTGVDLAGIELRAAAADPGPWHVERGHLGENGGYPQRVKTRTAVETDGRGWPQRVRLSTDEAGIVAETFTGPEHEPANALFIAAARADVPALVAEVRRLRLRLRLARARRLAWPWAALGWLVGFGSWVYVVLTTGGLG